MTHTLPSDEHVPQPRSPWSERDASDRHAMLTEILAQVSTEALQGETLEAVLRRIVDCVARRLPVAIASIVLLNDDCTLYAAKAKGRNCVVALPSGNREPL